MFQITRQGMTQSCPQNYLRPKEENCQRIRNRECWRTRHPQECKCHCTLLRPGFRFVLPGWVRLWIRIQIRIRIRIRCSLMQCNNWYNFGSNYLGRQIWSYGCKFPPHYNLSRSRNLIMNTPDTLPRKPQTVT